MQDNLEEPLTARRDWRQQVRFYLDDTDTALGQAVNGAIALLILLSAAIFVVETTRFLPPSTKPSTYLTG